MHTESILRKMIDEIHPLWILTITNEQFYGICFQYRITTNYIGVVLWFESTVFLFKKSFLKYLAVSVQNKEMGWYFRTKVVEQEPQRLPE